MPYPSFSSPFVTAGKGEAFCCAGTEMVGQDNRRAEDLNLCFERLMMVAGSGNSEKGVNLKAGVITEWKDIPVELLMQILSLVDDQTVITASGVCRGWRDAIYFGLARLSLSWYIVLSLDAMYLYLLAFCFSNWGFCYEVSLVLFCLLVLVNFVMMWLWCWYPVCLSFFFFFFFFFFCFFFFFFFLLAFIMIFLFLFAWPGTELFELLFPWFGDWRIPEFDGMFSII